MPVLYDPLGQLNSSPFNFPVNHYHVILNDGVTVQYKGKTDGNVIPEITEALAD